MTRHRLSPGSRHSKGFSLIELMISLVIGLIIAIAAGSAYLGSASAGRIAEAQSRMNEDGQAALSILVQQLRMAGDNPLRAERGATFLAPFRRNPIYLPYNTSTYTLTMSNSFSAFGIRGCDGKFNNISTAGGSLDTLDPSTCASGTSTVPDSIAVSYEADRYNTIPTTANLPTDCLGNALSSHTASPALPFYLPALTMTYAIADNRFYIGTSTGIVSPSLYCKGNGGASTAQPLVENVEDMQLSYGTVSTTTTSTTATVAGYLRANELAALATTPADDATRWGKVLTIRICVLIRSENPVAADANSARYDDCHGNRDVVAPDLRLRRAYSTTVVLRNRRS